MTVAVLMLQVRWEHAVVVQRLLNMPINVPCCPTEVNNGIL